MKTLRVCNAKMVLSFCMLIIGIYISPTTLAIPDVYADDLQHFTQPLNFTEKFINLLTHNLLQQEITETLIRHPSLVKIMSDRIEINKEELSTVLSTVMLLLEKSRLGLDPRKLIKKPLSIVAQDILPINRKDSLSFDITHLEQVGYRGFSLHIPNLETCYASKPSVLGIVLPNSETYSLQSVLSLISNAFIYKRNTLDLPQIVIDMTGSGIENNPQGILQLFSEKLEPNFKDNRIILKIPSLGLDIENIAKKLGIWVITDELRGWQFKDMSGQVHDLDDLRQALEWRQSTNSKFQYISEACNEGLRLQVSRSLTVLEGSDYPSLGMYASAKRLRLAEKTIISV